MTRATRSDRRLDVVRIAMGSRGGHRAERLFILREALALTQVSAGVRAVCPRGGGRGCFVNRTDRTAGLTEREPSGMAFVTNDWTGGRPFLKRGGWGRSPELGKSRTLSPAEAVGVAH